MITPKRLIDGSALTGSDATYYTSPALTRTIIKKLTLTNTTGGAVAVTVNLVPSGGSPGATNAVWSAETVADGAAVDCVTAEGQVLEAGGFISAKGLAVSIMASGLLWK